MEHQNDDKQTIVVKPGSWVIVFSPFQKKIFWVLLCLFALLNTSIIYIRYHKYMVEDKKHPRCREMVDIPFTVPECDQISFIVQPETRMTEQEAEALSRFVDCTLTSLDGKEVYNGQKSWRGPDPSLCGWPKKREMRFVFSFFTEKSGNEGMKLVQPGEYRLSIQYDQGGKYRRMIAEAPVQVQWFVCSEKESYQSIISSSFSWNKEMKIWEYPGRSNLKID